MKPFQNKSGSEKQDLQRDRILLRERERERVWDGMSNCFYLKFFETFSFEVRATRVLFAFDLFFKFHVPRAPSMVLPPFQIAV
jgi:hypothetical protein